MCLGPNTLWPRWRSWLKSGFLFIKSFCWGFGACVVSQLGVIENIQLSEVDYYLELFGKYGDYGVAPNNNQLLIVVGFYLPFAQVAALHPEKQGEDAPWINLC